MQRLIRESESAKPIRMMSPDASFSDNFWWTLAPATLALLLGGLLNDGVQRLQGAHDDRLACVGWFSVQLVANILLLVAAARAYRPLVPWIQLTVAGIISAVLFFAVQSQLTNNALCVVRMS